MGDEGLTDNEHVNSPADLLRMPLRMLSVSAGSRERAHCFRLSLETLTLFHMKLWDKEDL